MEVLDDTLDFSPELSRKSIIELFNLRIDYHKVQKAINNARITLGIISVLSIYSTMRIDKTADNHTLIAISIAIIILFGALAIIQAKYAKYTLTIALSIYILSLIVTFIFNPGYALLSLLIKGIIFYYITIGLIAAFKFPDLLSKMESIKILPNNI